MADPTPRLTTDRLILRAWQDSDRAPFAVLNADPAVMEFMPALMTKTQSDAMVIRIQDHFKRHGFGLWAVEVKKGPSFVGFVGLSIPGFEATFTPCVEIGWRLSRAAWGEGIATEAAQAALTYGFDTIGLSEILSFTTTTNKRSQAVMERIGMSRDLKGDFDHPSLPDGDPLRRHVLYRLTSQDWSAAHSGA